MNVVIAAGGTAGHVNPGVALADALARDARVSFIGTAAGVESRVVPARGYELDDIDVAGFDRGRPAQLPIVALRALKAVAAARRLLQRRSPAAVVGMGGYVSLPVCVAARTLAVPIVVHEQNIVLGLANRVARPLAAKVAVSFTESLSTAGPRAVLVGNPVSRAIAEMDRARARQAGQQRFGLDPARKTVMVFGGSLGARTLNTAAPALAEAWRERRDIQVLHISGRSGGTGEKLPLEHYHRIDYTDAMDEAYAAADVAVCRGGATTVAELTVVGLPAVIVPYPHHRDRQQERHAHVLAAAGAAVVVADRDATADRLRVAVEDVLSEDRLASMRKAAAALGRPDAADELAAVVKEVAR